MAWIFLCKQNKHNEKICHNFGDMELFLENYFLSARPVDVQLFVFVTCIYCYCDPVTEVSWSTNIVHTSCSYSRNPQRLILAEYHKCRLYALDVKRVRACSNW